MVWDGEGTGEASGVLCKDLIIVVAVWSDPRKVRRSEVRESREGGVHVDGVDEYAGRGEPLSHMNPLKELIQMSVDALILLMVLMSSPSTLCYQQRDARTDHHHFTQSPPRNAQPVQR